MEDWQKYQIIGIKMVPQERKSSNTRIYHRVNVITKKQTRAIRWKIERTLRDWAQLEDIMNTRQLNPFRQWFNWCWWSHSMNQRISAHLTWLRISAPEEFKQDGIKLNQIEWLNRGVWIYPQETWTQPWRIRFQSLFILESWRIFKLTGYGTNCWKVCTSFLPDQLIW